jgi:hypothetical protein
LLTTAAAVAFVGALAGSASAFEVVDWEWHKNIQEDWDIDVTIDIDLVPTGIVQIEKLQMHFGDVNSFAKVFGIENNPPIEGTGELEPFQIIANIDGSLLYTPSNGGSANPISPGQELTSNNLDVEVQNITGNVDENEGDGDGANVDLNFDVVVQVDPGEIEFGDPIDGAALPEVVNSATSVANNQLITSTSALMLHDAQIAAGGINQIDGEQGSPNPIAFLIAAYGLTLVDDELEDLNEHTDLAVLTILGAATGFIEPADIDADAWAFFIKNATVDNTATAVGNNASYEIDTGTPGNATMVADLTQLLIGNVNAVALAGGISVENYDLTDLGRPLVNNVATAVGNNLNIKVDACGGCVVEPPIDTDPPADTDG